MRSQFISYLRVPAANLDYEITVNGTRRPLFNQKEISHMDDVQKLFELAKNARLVAGAILLLVPLLGVWLGGGGFLPTLGKLLAAGGIADDHLLGLAGLALAGRLHRGFDPVPRIAFSNDDWMLDPRTDYLIMLFPEGFWLDASIRSRGRARSRRRCWAASRSRNHLLWGAPMSADDVVQARAASCRRAAFWWTWTAWCTTATG